MGTGTGTGTGTGRARVRVGVRVRGRGRGTGRVRGRVRIACVPPRVVHAHGPPRARAQWRAVWGRHTAQRPAAQGELQPVGLGAHEHAQAEGRAALRPRLRGEIWGDRGGVAR